ncbi:MAG: ABC transporter permease [Planctomycetaceae bacterium]
MRGLVRKEFLQVLRDPSSIAIAFVLPVVLLLLFGYGVSLDAEHVSIALVVDKSSADTASLCSEFEQSQYFRPRYVHGMHAAKQAMMERRVDAILHIRSDFSEKTRRPGGAGIQLIVNGVDANTGRIVNGYVQGVYGKWLEHRAAEQGQPLTIPVNIEQRVWFNANLRSRNFLVPGLIAVIMTLIGALLTALVVAREWERGTMEALMVTPVSLREILIGKVLPYFLLGMGGMTLSVLMAVWQFEVPLRGSLWALLLGTCLFLLTALGMGLLISTVARIQFVAAQVAIITTFLPAFILSGFIFDIGSMPPVIQGITHIVPARYFVAILQTVFLAGDVWSVLMPNMVALAVMATVFLGLTRLKARKRLD